jgi:hypothetical protein
MNNLYFKDHFINMQEDDHRRYYYIKNLILISYFVNIFGIHYYIF